MNKFNVLIAAFLLVTMPVSGQITLAETLWQGPTRTDTLYYPFYSGVQMIEIDNVGYWEADVAHHEQTRPRALSWSSLIPGPFPNVYLFRNSSGQIVKAFNTSMSLEQLTKDFRKIPIDKKSGGIHSLMGNFHTGKYHSGWYDYHSRMLDFKGLYLVYGQVPVPQKEEIFFGSIYPGGKVGLIDSMGNYFLPLEYNHIEPLNDNIIVCKDSTCGVIDRQKKVVIPMIYERHDYLSGGEELGFYKDGKLRIVYRVANDTYKEVAGYDWVGEDWLSRYRNNPRAEYPPLIPVRNGALLGLVDTGFVLVAPVIYDWCIPNFIDGLALVCRDKKFGYINTKGKEIIPCVYTYGENFRDGIAVVQHEGKFRNIDKKGKLLDTNVRQHEAWRNSEWTKYSNVGDLRAVQTNTGYGLVKANDVFVVAPIYQNIHPVHVVENGKSVLSKSAMEARRFDKLGLIDTAGNVLVPFEYEMITEYHGKYEFRMVKKDEQHWGVVNGSYDIVVPCIYDGIGIGYDQDYFTFHKDGKMGVMDTTGKILIPAEYKQIYSFVNGRALAVKDSLYGFIDRQGNVLIPLQYEQIHGDFVNGLTAFLQNEKWGYMDTTGAVIIKPQYEEVRHFESEITGVKLNGKWGFINRENKLLVEYKYDFVGHEWGHDNLIEVRRDGKLGFMDVNGKEVIPCIYDNQWGYGPKGHHLEKDGVRMWVKPE